MKRTVLVYGLIAGAVLSLMLLVTLPFQEAIGFDTGAVIGYTTMVAAFLPQGWALLATLLVVGAGALGVFPIYHALTQDLSPDHQGKVSGAGGVAAFALSPAHAVFGRWVDQSGSFDWGIAAAGCLPLVAVVVLWAMWNRGGEPSGGAVARG